MNNIELMIRNYGMNVIENYMDSELIERVYNEFEFYTNEEFLDIYCRLHYNKYNNEFIIKPI